MGEPYLVRRKGGVVASSDYEYLAVPNMVAWNLKGECVQEGTLLMSESTPVVTADGQEPVPMRARVLSVGYKGPSSKWAQKNMARGTHFAAKVEWEDGRVSMIVPEWACVLDVVSALAQLEQETDD